MVNDPQEVSPAQQNDVVLVHAKELRSLAALVDGAHGENEPGKCAKGEESPFVRTGHISRIVEGG